MDILEAIGLRMREIRQEKQWTQEQLGEKIGVSYSYIGRIERGQKNISLKTLEKVAQALGVSEADFFTYSSKQEFKSEKMKEIHDITMELYKNDFQAIAKVKPVVLELLKQIQK